MVESIRICVRGRCNLCYECACGSTTAIKSSDSITEDTFKRAAAGARITVEQAKRNALELLKKELGEK